MLDTELLINGLFENEWYLEQQINQIEISLAKNDLYGVCIDQIIIYCFGNNVLENGLKCMVAVGQI